LILKRTVFTCCIVLFGSSLFAEGLTLKSEEIAGQISMDQVFNGFGCKGNNASQGSIESKTDYGIDKFGGACPPKGDKPHTYVLTVYALDVEKLGLDKNATPALVGYMINAHTIQKSSIVAYYKR
jgi:Raf kinase inhibitor-like YbhB/YbcL family protein